MYSGLSSRYKTIVSSFEISDIGAVDRAVFLKVLHDLIRAFGMLRRTRPHIKTRMLSACRTVIGGGPKVSISDSYVGRLISSLGQEQRRHDNHASPAILPLVQGHSARLVVTLGTSSTAIYADKHGSDQLLCFFSGGHSSVAPKWQVDLCQVQPVMQHGHERLTYERLEMNT